MPDDSRWLNMSSGYPEYHRIHFSVLLLFCSYVLIWYLQIGSRIGFLGTIRIELIVAATLIPIALLQPQPDLECQARATPLRRFVVLYIFLLGFMTLVSYNVSESWNIFVNRVLKFSVMGLFIAKFVKSPRDMIFFLAAFLFACLKMGQEGMVGKLTGNMIWENQGVMRLHGSTQMYFHPNSFSGMALGTLPFVFYLFPIVSRIIKAIFVVQFVFAVNIIIFSGSRTGWVGCIGLLAIFILRTRYKVKVLLVLFLISLGTFYSVPGEYQDRFLSIFIVDKDSEAVKGGLGSRNARIQILKDAVKIFIDNPYGVGVGAFPYIREDVFGRSQDTHNLYLEVATNLGIQGIIVFGFILIYMMKMLSQSKKALSVDIQTLLDIRSERSEDYLEDAEASRLKKHLHDLKLLIAVCDSVILFISVRLALGIFGMDLYEIYWWFALGLTFAIINVSCVSHKRTTFLIEAFSANAHKD